MSSLTYNLFLTHCQDCDRLTSSDYLNSRNCLWLPALFTLEQTMGFADEVAYEQGQGAGLFVRSSFSMPTPHKQPSWQLSASTQTCLGVRCIIAAMGPRESKARNRGAVNSANLQTM